MTSKIKESQKYDWILWIVPVTVLVIFIIVVLVGAFLPEKDTDKNSIGIEREEKYYKIACDRIKN